MSKREDDLRHPLSNKRIASIIRLRHPTYPRIRIYYGTTLYRRESIACIRQGKHVHPMHRRIVTWTCRRESRRSLPSPPHVDGMFRTFKPCNLSSARVEGCFSEAKDSAAPAAATHVEPRPPSYKLPRTYRSTASLRLGYYRKT